MNVWTTAQQWLSSAVDQQAPDQAAAEKKMLGRQGFRAGATENLQNAANGDAGLSVVERFRSPAAARDALAFYVSQQKKPMVQSAEGKYTSFRVSGIPGVAGYSLGSANHGGINIAFTQGDSYYLVGREGGGPPAIAGLSTAARRLYRRMRG